MQTIRAATLLPGEYELTMLAWTCVRLVLAGPLSNSPVAAVCRFGSPQSLCCLNLSKLGLFQPV